MDVKATALLKLIYLEMVGHDMSWASFHVLEVMSSPKYHQKRVGYLGAVQSFRPDTEVLMLATNLLKKDLSAAAPTTISLPITALPHFITPSLALSTLADLLPRLNHTHPSIRKKTIVTLYRLALVYPETLRAAWPKIKDRLMDKDEDPSVTAAIVNVVCELGWRRPNDFLPLAPRLFELLVDGGNNWMAIKLIKLFATLTPLEPRLVRKLLPPLTEIIRTTPAMSLLYECINGIIQGGILGSADDISGREEIASLCVSKLRGMIMVDGDPNLKYVALLAFNKIVVTHPFLVAQQEDVILDCIDSPDITIRIKALDLVQGMVSSDNLVSIVSRLMRQLKTSGSSNRTANQPESGYNSDEEAAVSINVSAKEAEQAPPVPEEYRIDLIARVLSMCSQNNYGNLIDFEWYIDILTQLIRSAPVPRELDGTEQPAEMSKSSAGDITERIGDEIRNIAVKSVIKVFVQVAGGDLAPWTAERKARTSLLMARIINVFEPLVLHPNLEVQERAVEFTELLKLTAEAVSGQPASTEEVQQDAPLLLTQAIPSLFTGWELKSVAAGAQRNVPLPDGLDLDEPIHPNLHNLLAQADVLSLPVEEDDEFEAYYYQKPPAASIASNEPAINRLADAPEEVSSSYQQAGEESYLDPDILARRRAERIERNKDDPFYIQGPQSLPATSTPIHNILQNENGPDLDIDSIPIMQLDLDKLNSGINDAARSQSHPTRPKIRQRVVIAADETLASSGLSTPRNYDSENNSDSFTKSRSRKLRQSLLQVDSSNIGALNLEGGGGNAADGGYDPEQQKREEAEMAQAMKEVERLRLEMQRANERIHVAQGVPAEGAVVVKKKKKVAKKPKAVAGDGGDGDGAVKVRKKKKVAAIDEGAGGSTPASEGGDQVVVKPKKKKARPPVDLEEAA
ncbi:AP-3 complex subunit delta [Pleurostoma richardsiae]|uniref:AP-3 complex subunit delta n=1 Tax=Pleurostoma richardsiae TaxID=41990 RepID=A0AA38RTY3_9PEZI|nr:AP-3 complex subunit delta [Pleurostoma richardsiae]